jgi:hypothetical protein
MSMFLHPGSLARSPDSPAGRVREKFGVFGLSHSARPSQILQNTLSSAINSQVETTPSNQYSKSTMWVKPVWSDNQRTAALTIAQHSLLYSAWQSVQMAENKYFVLFGNRADSWSYSCASHRASGQPRGRRFRTVAAFAADALFLSVLDGGSGTR